MPKNFKQVDQNLYRGGAPSEQDIKILFDDFDIKRIVSLDGEIAHETYPTICDLGIDHIVIPLTGEEKTPTRSILYLMNNIVSLLNCGLPTFIHCRHGSDRTGLAIALYRVLNDGWGQADAINEAKQYQFGKRISEPTEEFYSRMIANKTNIDKSDVQDNDMVQFMRDTFEMGAAAPAFPPQQSFAPKEDIKFGPPHELVSNTSPESKDHFYFSSNQKYPSSKRSRRKRELRRLMMEELMQKSPLVGQHDNYDGVRGVGFGSDTGGFADSDPGGVPGGAGMIETGNLMNI